MIGELPPIPTKTWVPELLRNYGPRTMPLAELEAARRAFVHEALGRRLTRERQTREADRNARYASVEELLTPVIELLAELPCQQDCPDPEMQQLIDARASHILSAAGTTHEPYARGKSRPMERPAKAIATLETLRNAALELGPLAEQTLDLASELLNTYVEGGPGLVPHQYLLIDKIDAAIRALRPQVSKGSREPSGNRPRGARLADQVARAYAEITGELPPVTSPHHDGPMHERPYHRLVRCIFEHYQQKNWEECAKEAAKRLHEIGRQRHLKTARPGRPRRSQPRNRGSSRPINRSTARPGFN